MSVIKVTMKASKTNDGQYDDIDPYFDARTDTTSPRMCASAARVQRSLIATVDIERPERALMLVRPLPPGSLLDGDGESTEYDFSRCSSTSFGVFRPLVVAAVQFDAVVESSMARAICAASYYWLTP